MRRQSLAIVAMQSEFAQQRLVSRRLLRLPLDILQNDGIGEHFTSVIFSKKF